MAACSVLIKVLLGNTIKSNLLHPNHRVRVTAALLPISSITQSNSHHILFCFCFGSELLSFAICVLLRHVILTFAVSSCLSALVIIEVSSSSWVRSPIHLVPQTIRPSRGLPCCRFTLPAMLFDSFVAHHSM